MRKIIMLFMTVLLSICTFFPSCADTVTETEKIYYTVTFRQEGEEDIVKKVEAGKGLTSSDIPEPKLKDGYTVTVFCCGCTYDYISIDFTQIDIFPNNRISVF